MSGGSDVVNGAGTLDGAWNDQEPFTSAQIANLSSTIRDAEKVSKVNFETFVGRLPQARQSALALHSQLGQASNTVLIAVDPHSRGLEIVVGPTAKLSIDDRTCQLAALAMTSRFVVGDLINGLRDGISVMADHAHPSAVLHKDLPENA